MKCFETNPGFLFHGPQGSLMSWMPGMVRLTPAFAGVSALDPLAVSSEPEDNGRRDSSLLELPVLKPTHALEL